MIFGRLRAWALMLLAILLVLVGAYVKGGRAAMAAANQKRDLDEARRAAAGAKGVHDAQIQVGKMPTGAAAQQLRNDWMRDADDKA